MNPTSHSVTNRLSTMELVSLLSLRLLFGLYLVTIVTPQLKDKDGKPCPAYKRRSEDPSEIEFERLHALALQESGTVTVLEGGDEPDQLDFFNPYFYNVTSGESRFPCIKANWTVDLSNIHDIYINSALKALKPGEKLPFDVASLQSLHDFYIWRDADYLMKFKPVGSKFVPKNLNDPCGYFHAIKMVTFDHYAGKNVANKPTRYSDYLKPEWTDNGKLIFTYPQDDDAVLYQFHLILKKDPQFLEKLQKQKPKWVRGTATPYTAINKGVDKHEATFTTAGVFSNDPDFQPGGTFTLSPPDEEFITWGQMSAIFKDAANPNTAKLWITWWLSKEHQERWTGFQWAARTDIKTPTGVRAWQTYNNTSPRDFIKFIRNRTLVESLYAKIDAVIGKVPRTPENSPLKDKCLSAQGATCVIE